MAGFGSSGLVFRLFYPPRRFLIRRCTTETLIAAPLVGLWGLLLALGVRFVFLPGLATASPVALTGFYVGLVQGSRIEDGTNRSGAVVAWWRRFGPHAARDWALVLLVGFVAIQIPLYRLADVLGPGIEIPLIFALQMAIVAFPLGHLIGLAWFEKRRGVTIWYQVGIETVDLRGRPQTETRVYFTRPARSTLSHNASPP